MKQVINITDCPKSWNEVPTRKLEWVLSLYTMLDGTERSKLQLQTIALLGFNDLKMVRTEPYTDRAGRTVYLLRSTKPLLVSQLKERFTLRRAMFPIDGWALASAAEELGEFLFKPSTLTRSPYPELRVGLHRFDGPSDRIATMSWHQYKDVGLFYTRICETERAIVRRTEAGKGEDALTRKLIAALEEYKALFMASLFTPRGKEYSAEQKDRNYRRMRRVSPVKVEICRLFWDGCMSRLAAEFKYLFAAADGKQKKQVDPLTADTAVTASLMQNLNTADADVIMKQSCYTVLRVLDNMSHEAKMAREASERMKNKT